MEQTPAREYYQEQDSQDTLYVAQGLMLDGQEEHTDRGLTRGLVVLVVVVLVVGVSQVVAVVVMKPL